MSGRRSGRLAENSNSKLIHLGSTWVSNRFIPTSEKRFAEARPRTNFAPRAGHICEFYRTRRSLGTPGLPAEIIPIRLVDSNLPGNSLWT